jgi:hypothetical protein
MSKIKLGSVCIVLAFSAVSCSKSSSGGSGFGTGGSALSLVGSCSNDDQKLCKELYTAAFIEQYKTACSESQGTFSATTGCKAAGRVKGCQVSIQGVKTYTDWGYDEDSGDLVQGLCTAVASQDTTATYTVVTP